MIAYLPALPPANATGRDWPGLTTPETTCPRHGEPRTSSPGPFPHRKAAKPAMTAKKMLAPPTPETSRSQYDTGCAIGLKAAPLLDPANRAWFRAALADKATWPTTVIGRHVNAALASIGSDVRVSREGLRSHRNGDCTCARAGIEV